MVAALLFSISTLLIALSFKIQSQFVARRIFAKVQRPGQGLRELKNTVLFQLLAAGAFTVLIGAKWIVWTSGLAADLLTFAACWLGFEVYYYGMHRAMHARGLHRFHREHHESHISSPLSAFSLSAPEALGWILGYILVPLLMSVLGLQVGLAGWLAYVAYNYWGNIMGHVNVEVVPSMFSKRASSWLLHPITYHALHHARYAGHYGFGATFMDRLFGTEWGDWPRLHKQVLAGNPLVGDGRGSAWPGNQHSHAQRTTHL